VHAHPVSPIVQRLAAAAALVLALAIGVWCSGKLPSESAARVAEIRADEGDVGTARANAAAQRAALSRGGDGFARVIADDAARFGIAVPELAALREPHRHAVELEDAIVLAVGKVWSSPHLRITAGVEKVTYKQHGASVAANHSLVRIENVAKMPIAYLVRLASAERGRCEVRGARAHNAVSLRPEEVAEIVVCAGGGAVRVERVEVLELDELGHRYVSQLPPLALGHDEVTGAAHRPLEAVEICRNVDAPTLAQRIRNGESAWADVIDFHSRHDCHRYPFILDYRLATEPLPALPVAGTR
jgi:hypothetical protein